MYSSLRWTSSFEPELSIAGSLNLFHFPSTRGRTPDSSPASFHAPRNLLKTSLHRDLSTSHRAASSTHATPVLSSSVVSHLSRAMRSPVIWISRNQAALLLASPASASSMLRVPPDLHEQSGFTTRKF